MGLERGDIVNFESRPSGTIQMPKDMIALYRTSNWALLPTIETMKTIVEMCVANLNTPTKSRSHFTKFLPETEYTYTLLPVVTDENKLQPLYVNGKAYPFTDFPLVRTTLHPFFLFVSAQFYMAFHAPICATAGFKTSERINVTLALTFQMNQPINLSWFTGTDGLFPDRLPFYNPRPDPTPESDTTDRVLSWFQENIGDAPSEPDESDLRLLKKMSA